MVKSRTDPSTEAHSVPTARRSAALVGSLLGASPWQAAVLAITSVLSGLAEAGVLAVVAQVATILATHVTRVHARFGPVTVNASLAWLLVAGGILAAARLVLLAPTSYLSARIPADVQARMRRGLFDAFTEASWSVKADDREGHLQDMFNNQINMAIWGTVQATLLVTYLFSFAALTLSALVLSPRIGGIVVAVAVALFVGLRPLSRAGSHSARELSLAQLTQANGVSEAVRVAEESQVFGVAPAQRSNVHLLIERSSGFFFKAQLAQRLIPGLYQNVVYALLIGSLAAVYVFDKGGLALLGAVILILVRAGTYGNFVQSAYQVVRQSLPFIEQVRAAEERYRQAAPSSGWRPFRRLDSLKFVDVTFAYRQRQGAVLSGITFDVRPGEAIGIVGRSGAGKSTLAQVLLRLREPSSGSYLINGHPAQELRDEDWTARVAYVPQVPHLIDASVAENIRYFRRLSQPEVEQAAKLACIHDDVMSWADGYESTLGPRGAAISIGQAQRICLARALVARPSILLLDEPTSALDSRSEELLRESLASLWDELTLFVITHRKPLLDICDRVIVMDDGKLGTSQPNTPQPQPSSQSRLRTLMSGLSSS